MYMHNGFGISFGKAVRAAVLGTLLAGALAARAQAEAVISYPNFSSIGGLQLNGSATQVGSALQLTPLETYKSGSVFSDTEINPTGSFETEFELYMHENNSYMPADGIAFVLQSESAQALGEEGGSMGYQGIEPSAEVEFDLYQDTYDPPVPNVSFMENGNPETHLESKPTTFPLYDEHVWAWIDYQASTKELSVYVANADSKPTTPLFTYTVDLAEVLHGESAYAGFTSGTGLGDALQEVLSWQLSSELSVAKIESPPSKSENGVHGSSTSVSCNLIVATATDTCTATVTDVDVPAAITPTGQVSFASSSGGTFEGNTCNLAPVPNSPDAASCSVQFLPPSANSLEPAITATYGGDAHHSGSAGHTYYPGTVELGKGVEIGLTGILSESGGIVTTPIGTSFPSTTTGTLISGPDNGTSASLAGLNATAAKAKRHKRKAAAKPVVYGTGSLTLSHGGKGVLAIALNGKGKLALKKAKGKPVRLVLEVTVKTLNGTLVKTEKRTITVKPAAKKHKGKGHGKHG